MLTRFRRGRHARVPGGVAGRGRDRAVGRVHGARARAPRPVEHDALCRVCWHPDAFRDPARFPVQCRVAADGARSPLSRFLPFWRSLLCRFLPFRRPFLFCTYFFFSLQGIVVRDMSSQVISFYVKGADSAIAPMVTLNDWLEEECGNMAREGLRTLVCARKHLSEGEYRSFEQRWRLPSCAARGWLIFFYCLACLQLRRRENGRAGPCGEHAARRHVDARDAA